jgi:uncharacterized protein
MNKTILALAVIAAIVLSFASGYLYGYSVFKISAQPSQMDPVPKQAQPANYTPASIESSATIKLAAVDADGNGAAIPLVVQRRTGHGETLIDINNLVFWFDTQQSIQTARGVAQNLTGIDAGSINLVYMIDTNATIVEGPSAGAALAVATIAALENRTLAPDVMITGTINPDGTIGQVGGILEKAKAAKQVGASLFLVPKGQGTETSLKPVETCSERGQLSYCTTRYYRTATDISEAAGIDVKEVSTVAEAEKYFFG